MKVSVVKVLSHSFTHNQGPKEEGDGLVELHDVEQDRQRSDEKLQPCSRHVLGFKCHSEANQDHQEGPLNQNTHKEKEQPSGTQTRGAFDPKTSERGLFDASFSNDKFKEKGTIYTSDLQQCQFHNYRY